ncbi:MAG: hypothetical protein HRU32_15060 [Rhodobacteraceae bacterium]|nr:hypothetical protein [Paracoccaceae bacterium]
MKYILPFTAALFAATTLQAEPYCGELLNKEALPTKLAKVAPVYSDSNNGWIFTSDQLKDRYDMKSSSQELVQAIVNEFTKRDVQLAIMIAPPRPVVAGQAQLDATMGEEHYDIESARSSFNALIEELAKTGVIVPNLLELALADPDLRKDYYFHRDTHWTTVGAAFSAIELARSVDAIKPELFPNDGVFGADDLVPFDAIEEEGSLANLVQSVCEISLDVESATGFDLTRSGGLLEDDQSGPPIALLGSSFSDRYKRDHYRVSDALARAFDSDVENYSISGGGPIGAIEAYVLSGALDRREHPLVIWELPFTESFNSVSFLRQLLGALQRADTRHVVVDSAKEGETVSIKIPDGSSLSGIEIQSEDLKNQKFRLEVRFDNGSTTKMSLNRRSAVPANMRHPSLFSSLRFFGERTPIEIIVSPEKSTAISAVAVF